MFFHKKNLINHKYLINEISNIPKDPGVYKFLDKENKIIYVGKAKNLKNRISSYFINKEAHGIKTKKLISEINNIEITLVKDNFEALLLENNFIKNHQPKYNILLKDDKSYPYVCISEERFPKIYTTYKNDKIKGKFYGPFLKKKYAEEIIDLIREVYPFRTCNYNLSEKNIENKKFKPCLEYHLKNCNAPCIGLQTEKSYLESTSSAINILKGNFSEVKNNLKSKMKSLSDEMKFEEASFYKRKLDLIDNYQKKSIIINPELGCFNVFGIDYTEDVFFINYMEVKNGAISFSKTFIAEKKIEERNNEVLEKIFFEIITLLSPNSNQNISNIEINFSHKKYKITTPEIGDKKKIVLLAQRNAMNAKQDFLEKKIKNSAKINSSITDLLQKDLSLPHPPDHIVCFDNSNLCGTNPVAAMVCFKNGKPAKKFYRRFNIKTVLGPNDFASMEEVVFRTFENKKEDLPNLIVVDGGKGQLSSAIKSLKKVNLYPQIPIISIAKGLEEIYKPEENLPICINKKSPSLKLIQKIRDEAHRFAIEFHRKKRSADSLKTTT